METLRDAPEATPSGTENESDTLDRVLQLVFTAALPLTAARGMTDGLTAARLDDVIGQLDDLVRELHQRALTALAEREPHGRATPAAGRVPQTHAPIPDHTATAVEQLAVVLSAQWVDAFVGSVGATVPRDLIADAARLVRLAGLDLPAADPG